MTPQKRKPPLTDLPPGRTGRRIGRAFLWSGLVMMVLVVVTISFDPLKRLARGTAGLALLTMGVGAALKTWADGREGVIRGKHDQVEFREQDLPHTFAASVAFHIFIWLTFAAFGAWMLLTAGHWR